MKPTERRQRIRAILAGRDCVHPASVFDPLSARIATDIGFEMGMFAGSVASLTVLGAPDLIVLTLTEFAEQLGRISRAGPLPVMVDADHGYGNALSVMRTVAELETAGVAALTIEDTLLPVPFGGAKPALVSRAEGEGKIRAALAARTDPATVVVARTSAAGIADTDEAIARLTAYQALGADALFLVGVRDVGQLDAIAKAVTLPLVIAGMELGLDRAALAARGVRIALQGHQPIAAAMEAVRVTMQALRDGADPKALAGLPSPSTMARITRDEDYRRWSREFLEV